MYLVPSYFSIVIFFIHKKIQTQKNQPKTYDIKSSKTLRYLDTMRYIENVFALSLSAELKFINENDCRK